MASHYYRNNTGRVWNNGDYGHTGLVMTEPTEKQKRQFLSWEENNPHKMKEYKNEYIENYVEQGDELENRSGNWADLLSIEIAEYQLEYFLNTKETERKINEYTEKFVDELMYMDKPYNPNDPMV